MNNRGFTLIEFIFVIVILSIVFIGLGFGIENTFSLSSEKSYEILKESIILQVNNFINECDNNLINCENDYKWQINGEKKVTSFNLRVLKKYNYLSNDSYINPITNEEISDCLIVNVIKNLDFTLDIELDDSNCKNKE